MQAAFCIGVEGLYAMAEQDERLVTITLDRRRPYRVNQTDHQAVWVGPGRIKVPAWVAKAWDMEPELTDTEEPAPQNMYGIAVEEEIDDIDMWVPGKLIFKGT